MDVILSQDFVAYKSFTAFFSASDHAGMWRHANTHLDSGVSFTRPMSPKVVYISHEDCFVIAL